MFYRNMPTLPARAQGMAGITETWLISTSYQLQIPLSLRFDAWTKVLVSIIKAGLCFPPKNSSLNNYSNVDLETDFIRMAYGSALGGPWKPRPPITRALKGSTFAVVYFPDADGLTVPHIYYQDPELRLREHCYYFHKATWGHGVQISELCTST